MACQLLANFFKWALENEKQQPAIELTVSTSRFQPGLKGQPPHTVLAGFGKGELFYSPAHVVQTGRVHLLIPPSFAGEINYTPEGQGATQKINVQILAFGNSFSVTFHPPAAPLNGGFVPSCSPVPIGTRAGTITGFLDGLLVTMHLT